ncbi:hypothetical protein [Bradyrhizobium canariense]|nr:hypothetical protein [Bradyrhizobium canariense]
MNVKQEDGKKLEGWLSLSTDTFKSEACSIVGPALISASQTNPARAPE